MSTCRPHLNVLAPRPERYDALWAWAWCMAAALGRTVYVVRIGLSLIWAPFLWVDLHLLPRHNIIRCMIVAVFLLLAFRPVVYYWCDGLPRDVSHPPEALADTLLSRGRAETLGDDPLVSDICDVVRSIWRETGDSCTDLYSFLQVPRSATKPEVMAALRRGPMHCLGLRSRAVVVLSDNTRRNIYHDVFGDIMDGTCNKNNHPEHFDRVCPKSRELCG